MTSHNRYYYYVNMMGTQECMDMSCNGQEFISAALKDISEILI